MTASPLEPCPGCGALVPAVDGPGPTHEYMLASPGCWALFGEVSGRSHQYADARYRAGGLQVVDAYAVQHPGVPERRSRQSVWIHLVSLCLRLEHSLPDDATIRLVQRLASEKREYPWLEPPASLGAVTVVDVHAAVTAEEHVAAVRRWCESAWDAWTGYRERIRKLAARIPDGVRPRGLE
jgi:Family of unknown function (DUF5946)